MDGRVRVTHPRPEEALGTEHNVAAFSVDVGDFYEVRLATHESGTRWTSATYIRDGVYVRLEVRNTDGETRPSVVVSSPDGKWRELTLDELMELAQKEG